ncbi:AMP-binding protein, partial [Agrobacterium deltaense]|uniref:AMP-binding protein n=1 Tax=Agrobacterium deltaense TaxID=1183412 RepID=UPI001C6ED43B
MASIEGHDVEGLVDVFRRNAHLRADDIAYNFLHNTTVTASITYGQLYRAARDIAYSIQDHVEANARAVLCYPPGLDFVKAFWACHLAGVIAVPVPVIFRPRDRTLFNHMISNCAPSVVLTDSETSRRLSQQKLELGKATVLCTDVIPAAPALWDVSSSASSSPKTAVLQYTSGSTSTPKGVMISDANLIFTARSMISATGLTKDSVGLNWVPHYHDMGLVGGIVTPMVAGFPVFLMSHFSAMSRPASWLKAISENRVTISGGPNFAFEACLRIPDADVLDINLKSWTVAYNGAEPIREATLRRFQERFGFAGFSREAIYPCYGLAESTLMVAGGPSFRGFASLSVDTDAFRSGTLVEAPADSGVDVTRLVSSGTILESCKIEIVDPQTRTRRPKGQIGEIWIEGPHVGLGYWNNEVATTEVFRANIANENTEFLRSGDLGFIYNEHLFVVGRIKDLIVINGQNIYPHDIEELLESSHVAIKAGTTSAFATEIDNAERVTVVCEVEQKWKAHFEEIVQVLRKSLVDDHAIILHSIAFVQKGALPKTTSGKVRRAATRQAFQSGELPTIHLWRLDKDETSSLTEGITQHHEIDDVLAAVSSSIQDILHPEASAQQPLDLGRSLVHLGLDSIEIMRLSNRIEELFNVSIPSDVLFGVRSVVELARKVREFRSIDGLTIRRIDPKYTTNRQAPRLMPVARDGEIALSFSQNRLWVLEQLEALGAAYNIAAAVR